MSFIESDRMRGVSGSIIRELFKMTAAPDMISFAGGNPSPDTFPMEEMAAIANDALLHRGASMLQYGFTEGFPPLRETLKQYLGKKHGFPKATDELITVSGGQQAADLTAKVLLNEGDSVLCEELSFVGVLNTFRAYGAKLVGVKMEPDGMNIEDLEKKIQNSPKAKLIYIIPNFQNPTGFTTSLEKRKQIYALAQRYDLMILEDDPYGELRYEGEFLPPLKSMDTDGRVIFAGSFSKTMAPALRVGFLVAAGGGQADRRRAHRHPDPGNLLPVYGGARLRGASAGHPPHLRREVQTDAGRYGEALLPRHHLQPAPRRPVRHSLPARGHGRMALRPGGHCPQGGLRARRGLRHGPQGAQQRIPHELLHAVIGSN